MKISLILLCALAAEALLRRRSAALRHGILAAAIACAAAAPMLQMIAPAWHVPVPSSSAVITLRDGVTSALPSRVPLQRAGRDLATTVYGLLWPVWMAGVASSLLVLLIGFTRLRRLASRSHTLARGRWPALLVAISRAYGPRRPVTLLQSRHPSLLVTWGVVRPKVILPAVARDWSDARMRVVLSHELAHIRRGDWAIQMAAELFRSVYWFNPIVWIVCRRLRDESEQACDDAVLNQGVESTEYATHLVDVARSLGVNRQSFVPALAIARANSLERRISAMLNDRHNRTPVTRSACIAIVIAVLGIALPIAGFGAAAQSGSATFSGSVLDPLGKILPNAMLVLSNVSGGAKQEARSDDAGQFRFTGVPAGDYVVKGVVPGLDSDERVRLEAGVHLQRDVTLQLGMVHETLTVTTRVGPTRAPRPALARRSGPPEPNECTLSGNGGCIDAPMKLKDVRPEYPAALRDSAGGAVTVEGRIGTDGFVKGLHVLTETDPAFTPPVLAAVQGWEFEPTRLDGVTVETRMRVVVTFTPSRPF